MLHLGSRVLAVVGLPTISNLKGTKMLVDGGAGLNLISPAVSTSFR